MSSNGGGPWGTGGGDGGGKSPWGGGGGGGDRGGGQRPPDIEDILREGRERLKVIMGGGGGGRGKRPGGGGAGGLGKGGIALIAVAAIGFYLWNAVYTVKPEERSVILTFGERTGIGTPGLNFILWPVQTKEIVQVTRENTVDIGSFQTGTRESQASDKGLMLTGDANIIDIGFQLVWNVKDPEAYLFNLADPEATVTAVAESAMREVIGRSEMKPILNRDRAEVSQQVSDLIQTTMDTYQSGINVVRLNLDKADPPREVIDSFRDVQAAEQERDTLEKRADAYANKRLAGARGESAQLLQEAEGYRAKLVNEADGEASRFKAIFEEYAKAQEVTRKRLYLESMERVFADIDKVIIDDGAAGGQGVVPYLPLNELRKTRPAQAGQNDINKGDQ
ncbi:FtsH protease activity modulator HflK [Pikeienuella sp. HZG-20]|uniref:FtsH protease activity modulator HflK n=1 Tax=Paludibacillus litoralis TaxID=3133267 RepID=UPI0030ECF5F0